MATEADANPLIFDGPFPAYDAIKAEHVVPGIRTILKELHAEIDQIEKDSGDFCLICQRRHRERRFRRLCEELALAIA